MKIISDLSLGGRLHRPRSGLPQPSMRLDFITGAYHPGGFGAGLTFGRAGVASVHDASGVMQMAAADQPRIEHDVVSCAVKGLLIEGSRTNLLTYSEDLSNPAWSRANTVVVGQKIAATGAGMSKVAWTETAGFQHIINRGTLPVTAAIGQVLAVTIDVEPAEMTTVQMTVGGTDSGYPLINLAPGGGVTGGNGKTTIQRIGSVCRITMICTATATSLVLYLYPGGTGTGAGDGSSGLWVGRAQLEFGNCATSYIPTTSTALTRAADLCTLSLGGWWNTTEGTMLVEWHDLNQQIGNSRIIGMAGSRSLMHLSGATGQNNAVKLEAWNGTAAVGPTAAADITKGIQRGVAAWSASGRSLGVRNTLATVATPLWNSGAPTELYLGHDGAGLQVNGCLRRITYFSQRLSDAQLLSLAP